MSIPITEVAIIIQRQNGGCAYCNSELNLGDCIVEEATRKSIKKQDIKIDSDDAILIEAELKTWRTGKVRQISKGKEGKKQPAYIVLKNEEIKDIARLMPDDEKAFKEIYGFMLVFPWSLLFLLPRSLEKSILLATQCKIM